LQLLDEVGLIEQQGDNADLVAQGNMNRMGFLDRSSETRIPPAEIGDPRI
jgi:hypothetical protein